MPITFGSVGDIISVCLVIKDLIKVLDDSRGSSNEYQAVIRELWSLDRAVLEVELLSRSCERTLELNALGQLARQSALQCKDCVEDFLARIAKYEQSLRAGGSSNSVRDAAKKLQWRFTETGDLVKFRAQLSAHTASINMLLITASV